MNYLSVPLMDDFSVSRRVQLPRTVFSLILNLFNRYYEPPTKRFVPEGYNTRYPPVSQPMNYNTNDNYYQPPMPSTSAAVDEMYPGPPVPFYTTGPEGYEAPPGRPGPRPRYYTTRANFNP